MELSLSFMNSEELIHKLYEVMVRYGVLNEFINYAIKAIDLSSIKQVEKLIFKRKMELESIHLRQWNIKGLNEFVNKTNDDENRLVKIIYKHGEVSREKIIKETNFKPEKITSLISGITKIAKSLRYRPPIVIERKKNNQGIIVYKLESSFKRSLDEVKKRIIEKQKNKANT